MFRWLWLGCNCHTVLCKSCATSCGICKQAVKQAEAVYADVTSLRSIAMQQACAVANLISNFVCQKSPEQRSVLVTYLYLTCTRLYQQLSAFSRIRSSVGVRILRSCKLATGQEHLALAWWLKFDFRIVASCVLAHVKFSSSSSA